MVHPPSQVRFPHILRVGTAFTSAPMRLGRKPYRAGARRSQQSQRGPGGKNGAELEPGATRRNRRGRFELAWWWSHPAL